MIANLDDVRGKIAGKTVLVTGGAGFLGSWLSDVLVELNANVIYLDNLASGLESNVSRLLGKDNFAFIRHDITRPIFFDEDLEVLRLGEHMRQIFFTRYLLSNP